MKDFLKAERVWTDQNDAVLQIEIKFRASGALLKIACESDYAVYLDGSFVYAGAYWGKRYNRDKQEKHRFFRGYHG